MLYAPIAISPFHRDGQPWCQWLCWIAAPLPLTYFYTCGWLSTSGQIKVPGPRPDYVPPLCIYDWGYPWKHPPQHWQSWTWLSQVKLTWNLALGLELDWSYVQTKLIENFKRQRQNRRQNFQRARRMFGSWDQPSNCWSLPQTLQILWIATPSSRNLWRLPI